VLLPKVKSLAVAHAVIPGGLLACWWDVGGGVDSLII
jgi:hypothetical protein